VKSWFSDAWVVFRIEFQRLVRGWSDFLLTSIISAATFFMLRLFIEPSPTEEIQILAGAIVFGVGMQSISRTGGIMISERFEGQMKLFMTSPIPRSAYVVGVTLTSALTSSLTALLVLGLAKAAGVAFHFNPLLLLLIIMTGLALPGIAVVVATRARTAQTGYMLSDTIGIVVSFVSPVFYPIERLPEALQWIARFSPFTHAGQAFREILNGGSSVLIPILVLLAFMVVANALGVSGMRWRER